MGNAPAGNAQLLRSFIGGSWRGSSSAETVPDVNPSDPEDVVGRVPVGEERDAEAAVAAAADALPAWKALPGPARGEHLHRWAGAVAHRQEELAQAMAREVGKPISEARGEVARCVALLRYYAGEAVRASGEVIPAQAAGCLQFTLREPLGVVALVTPWNFPMAIPLWKAAPALAFGNTVVLKPAEAASNAAVLLAETASSAGLPPGAFNVLLGSGSVIGEPLIRHERVRGVSFTGSASVGARVAAAAAARNIRYQTEMGGKNVAIVLADADLDLAASLVAAGAMRYAGQKCTATSRAVVARAIASPFLSKLAERVAAMPLGPVTDPEAAVGPLISEASREFVRKALAESRARLVCGGAPPADPRLARGYFLSPAVLAQVEPDSRLAQEELFGPVLAVLEAGDREEAFSLANRTAYGLSASLFTRDIGSALAYIVRIEAGLVRVNGDTTGVDPHAPFGGMKGSSSGSREQGSAAREFYTEVKTVQINPA
jgi:acyl-CoA reductase-like NAD-dependent aldehyde dehydrogenase